MSARAALVQAVLAIGPLKAPAGSRLVQAFTAAGGTIRAIPRGNRTNLHADLLGLTGRHASNPDKAVRHWIRQARRSADHRKDH